MNNEMILEVLGVNTEMYTQYELDDLVKQFRLLLIEGFHKDNIWLKLDFGIYTEKKAYAYTNDLVVAKAI